MDRNTLNRDSGRLLIQVLKTWQNAGVSVHGEGCCFHKTLRWQLLSVTASLGTRSKRSEGASLLISNIAPAGCTSGAQLSALLHPTSAAAARGRALVNAGKLTHGLRCHKNQHEPGEMLVPDSPCYQDPKEQRRHGGCWMAASSFSTPCFNWVSLLARCLLAPPCARGKYII